MLELRHESVSYVRVVIYWIPSGSIFHVTTLDDGLDANRVELRQHRCIFRALVKHSIWLDGLLMSILISILCDVKVLVVGRLIG